ncbi:PH domain-containing protein [Saccharopolyspora kobensis]|uniref:PH domain-containing protein n=1 Tax=Saccharopolyspora kobensis TaxID=146035 RepID=A0A1H6DHY2_9PSEU|nr:PH domain-containing protein [Saccharopolyspora kobensis]SEG84839.1 PH domain-containing protein [Saccharopolyspora kobensis]SFD26629.1 PH domain-containing protein [Saccharopolyspora kobensis]
MDVPNGSQQWATPAGLVATGWVLTAAAAAWWFAAESAVDRTFVGVLVLALAVASAHATICRPRLSADREGVTVRGLGGRRRWPWSAVTVQVRSHRRFGREVQSLELDSDAVLVILTRLDLGTDPQDVAEALRDWQR